MDYCLEEVVVVVVGAVDSNGSEAVVVAAEVVGTVDSNYFAVAAAVVVAVVDSKCFVVVAAVDSSHFGCFGLNCSTQFGGSILYYIN